MPFPGAKRTFELSSGISTGDLLDAEPAARLPVGFDAVAQLSSRLLQASLAGVFQAAGMASIETRRPLGADELPPSIQSTLPTHVTSIEPSGAVVEFAVEFRLADPRLRTLGEPSVAPLVIAAARGGSPAPGLGPKPAEIAWTVEFNLLQVKQEQADAGVLRSARVVDGMVASIGDLVVGPGFTLAPRPTIVRTRIAKGIAVTRTPTTLVSRLDILQMWVEFDLAASTTAMEESDPLMAELLAAPVGETWLEGAKARLTSTARLRACPRVALGGALTASQVAGLGLTDPRADCRVHALPGGAEILSLAASFGNDAAGLIGDVQPFIGLRDFAIFLSAAVMNPVVRARWRAKPVARRFTSNLTLRMPISEDSATLGDGTVRVRVRLGELSAVGLMAAPGPLGDVVRLSCDEEIEVLAVWWPSGERVEDLGDLGKPTTFPMTVNVAPFGRPEAGTNVNAPFRLFLLSVLEPLAVPLLDRFGINRMEGFVSEALDASICRWSLPLGPIRPVGDHLVATVVPQ
jgi:hypothetical protein